MSLLDALQHVISPGDHVCEIGTHLGEMTLFLRDLVGDSGAVTAYEMDPLILEYVRSSMLANDFRNVDLRNSAVHNRNHVVKMAGGYGDFSAMTVAFPEINLYVGLGVDFFTQPESDWMKSEFEPSAPREVRFVELHDDLVDDVPIDVYFMDIEGAETYAIPSILALADTFNSKPTIVF